MTYFAPFSTGMVRESDDLMDVASDRYAEVNVAERGVDLRVIGSGGWGWLTLPVGKARELGELLIRTADNHAELVNCQRRTNEAVRVVQDHGAQSVKRILT